MKNTPNRNGFIELCRFILALCVVSHHTIFYQEHGHIPFFGGYIAVEFFFILTGFFLFKSAKSGGGGSSAFVQVVKRLSKVYPYFLVCWLASFAISHIYNNQLHIGEIAADLVKGIPQLLLLSMAGLSGGTIGLFDYVGTGWYLSALVIAIFTVYPVMCMFCRSDSSSSRDEIFSGGIAPFIALLCYGYIGYNYNFLGVVNERLSFAYLGCVRAVGGICLGSFCYYLSQKLRKIQLTNLGNYVVSAAQILILALSLYLMEHYTGFYDILQVILFSFLIILSFGFDTAVNQKCSNSFAYTLGKFSMVIFVTQCLAYMYPVLPYPTSWKLYYVAHFAYIILFSLANYGIVALFKKFFAVLNLKKRLFQDVDCSPAEN